MYIPALSALRHEKCAEKQGNELVTSHIHQGLIGIQVLQWFGVSKINGNPVYPRIYRLSLQLSKVTDIVGKHGVVVGNLWTLTKPDYDGQAGAWGWILAKTCGVLHVDRVDDSLVHELYSRIRIKVGSQTAGDSQQGECVDQNLEQAEL